MANKEPIGWYTRGGKHIPIFDEEDRIKKEEDKKNREIEASRKEADKLNVDDDIKDFVIEAEETMKTYGFGRVIINESSGSSMSGSYGKAGSVVDKSLEKKLADWGNRNNYSINFHTETKNSSGVRQQLKYGYQQKKTQTKKRIMYVYKKQD